MGHKETTVEVWDEMKEKFARFFSIIYTRRKLKMKAETGMEEKFACFTVKLLSKLHFRLLQ